MSTKLPNGLDRRSTLGLAGGLLLFGAQALQAELARAAANDRQPPAGTINEVKGNAFATTDGARRALERAAPIFIGDMLATDPRSRLTARLGTATTLKLGEMTQVQIDNFLADAGGEITLQSGPIYFEGPSGAALYQFKIRSLFGLIAVRGTRFFAGPSAGVFGIFVERGEVSVSAAGKAVIVRAGQGTNISRPGAAPTRPKVWSRSRIRDALSSIS